MKRRFMPATAATCLLACATQGPISTLPYCADAGLDWLAPDHSCPVDAELSAFRNEVEELIAPAAGPLLVRISLSADAAIADACVVRGYGMGQWRARRRLAKILHPPPSALRAPACAANTRLDFNRTRAAFEFIRFVERECERQSTSPWQVVACLDASQQRRAEIWIQGIKQRYRVFVPTAEPAARRTALLACTERGPASGDSTFPPVGIARVGVDLQPCMRAQGWREIK